MKRALKLYYTTDTHGYLFPTDYISKTEIDMGLLSCTKAYQKDGNTLILDAGDTLQGSAFVKEMWNQDKEGCKLAEAFNDARYDYITLGNHDFNYGYTGIQRYLSASKAQCLACNVKDKTGNLPIKPYAIHILENGLRIGIVGFVTDYVKLWEAPEHLTCLEISDTFTAAKAALEEVKPQCDIVIGLYHGGFECDLTTHKKLEKGTENVGYRICKELDFDVLLTGHQHMLLEGQYLFGTYVMQLPANAQRYGYLEIIVEATDKNDKRLTITSELKIPKAISEEEIPSKWLEMQNKVQAKLDQKLGSFTEEIKALSKLEVAKKGSRLADFCNQIQLEYTGADLSCISLGNNPIGFNKEVTTREVMAAYQFPNTIKVLEVDEKVLRQALERCAEYFSLEDGEIVISKSFLQPKVEHYNYDFFAGLNYSFDLTKPVGSRVTRLEINQKPLGDKKYTLTMSDYRATGTGGYEIYQSCKVLKEYAVDIQELAINYIKEHGEVQIMPKPDFKLIDKH